MAVYHFSAQVIGRSDGRSSTAAAGYRAGEIVIDERTGVKHDFSRKKGIVHSEILAPAGAPAWCRDRSDLWNWVEKKEKRKDAQLCKEINVALPCELSKDERLELVRGYVADTFVSAGMVADLCIHAPTNRADDKRNHHAHIMLTMRRLDGDDFGPKERSWNAPELLMQWREKWADACNAALEKAGRSERVDHRSHADRGITEQPGQHYGPAVSDILSGDRESEVADRIAGERAAREMAQLAAQIAIARAQATAALDELAAAEAEAEAERVAVEAAALAQAEADAQALEAAQAEATARKEKERAAAEAVAQALAVVTAKEQAQAQAQAVALAEQQARVQARQERAAVEAAALAQAEADAQALAAQMQKWRDQAAASKAQEDADQAQALAQVWRDHASAEKTLADAVRDENTAQARVDELRPAHDEAISGQRDAQSVWQRAKALAKAPVWSRAIEAYDAAVTALKAASATVQRARQAVAKSWLRVLQLDPTEKQRQAAAQAAQAAKIEAQRVAQEQVQQARLAREQEKKDAVSARLRELERPAGWTPAKPPSEHSQDPPKRNRNDPERGG